MKYITHNHDDLINSNGTHGLGQIHATYAQLVSTFGEPLKEGFDDYKSDAEWLVQFDDGLVATIYNWKNGFNYCGNQGTPTAMIKDWHIGGNDAVVIAYINDALKELA